MKKTLLSLILVMTISYSFSQQTINLTSSDVIQDVIDTLTMQDAVIINLAPGNYTQDVFIGEALATSSTNTLIIQSADVNNMATVASTAGTSFSIGAPFITLKNMNIESETGYAVLIDGMSQAQLTEINIIGCNISSTITGTANLIYFNNNGGFSSSSNILITECNFNYGETGVKFECEYNLQLNNLTITNNTFINQRNYPVYLNYVNNLDLSNNTINLPTYNPSSYWDQSVGVYLSAISTTTSNISKVSNNIIQNNNIDSVRYTGIRINNCFGNDSIYISNNYIDINNVDSLAYGIICDYAIINIYHNTIDVSGLKSTAIKVLGSAEVPKIKNNIFNAENVAIEVMDIASLVDVDYNCYYAGDSLPFTNGIQRFTLTQWYSENASIDISSTVEDPQFTTDMNFTNIALDNSAAFIPEIEFDINGIARNQPMCDMGAKELMFIDLGADIELCAGDTLTITSPTAYSYLWSTGATTQSIQVFETGTYSITVQESEFGPVAEDSINVIQAPNSVVMGTVSYSGGNFDANDVNVELYIQHQENAYYIEQVANDYISSSSTFMFTDVEPNHYAIRGVMESTSYNGVVTCYYGNTVDWEDATYINVGCGDTLNYNFTMYELTNLTGPCTFRGNITYTTSNKSLNLTGEPVTGAEIYVAQDPNDEPVANAISGANGAWEINGLEEGTGYNIVVDIPGLNLISTYSGLSIASGDTAHSDLNFIVDTASASGGIYIDTATAIFTVNNEQVELLVYPNPVTSFINIETELNNPTNIEFTILNVSGKTVYTSVKEDSFTGKYNKSISMDEFENGVYFLNLRIGDNFYIKKIIKE